MATIDSEDLMQCPYDKNHMIRHSRFPYHLVKCRENHPTLARSLVACPYNARHRLPKRELAMHMSTCESRGQEETPMELPLHSMRKVTYEQPEHKNMPSCEENWEDEDTKPTASPFVLNGFGNYVPYDGHENPSEEYYEPGGKVSTVAAVSQPSQWQAEHRLTTSRLDRSNMQTKPTPVAADKYTQSTAVRKDNPWARFRSQSVPIQGPYCPNGQEEQWPSLGDQRQQNK
ncbi:gametocyte-specific factor 1-like isoform 2-T3 [Discoglossus pictus]